ncbi:hypothetical protein PG995_004910 [Apiospora arundinis]
MKTYGKIWQKRWFIPAWLIQWAFALLYVVSSCSALVSLDRSRRHGWEPSNATSFAGWAAYILVVSLLTVFANVAECYLFARRALSPALVVSLGAARFVLWLVILGRSANFRSSYLSFIDIIIDGVVLLATVVQIVLGAINLHKLRKGTLVAPEETPSAARVRRVSDCP